MAWLFTSVRWLLSFWLLLLQALSGTGGGVSASIAGDRKLTAVSTTFTNNTAVSGGAVFVSGPTNDVAVGHFSCNNCTLKNNKADSKVGGVNLAVAACGPAQRDPVILAPKTAGP